MRHVAFYTRVFGLILLIGLIIYILVSTGRFLYYRQVGLTLAAVLKTDQYTLGQGGKTFQVAILGDSTAYGTGASDFKHTYHYQFLAQQPGTYEVHNYGVVGAQLEDVNEQLQKLQQIDLILISVLGNDVTHFTPLDTLRTQLDQVLTTAESKAKQVILITPGSFEDAFILPWPIRQALVYRGGQVSALAKEVASQHQVIHVDMYSQPEYSFSQDPQKYFATDYFHPSDSGYAFWSQAIQKAVSAAGGLRL